MTDKKFTDEEIIKALECCYTPTGNCENSCPMYNLKNCNDTLMAGYVRDLINRQKAEIERLKTENKIYVEANQVIGYQRDQRDKEIDELQKQINGLDVRENKIKAEAYKEFAERLNNSAMSCLIGDKYSYKIITTQGIDNLLKEMVGEE